MNNITLAFGKRVRGIRISKNISQEKLAELCGLHPTYIGQLERGEKSPTLDSIYKISNGLEVSVGKLFYNIDNILNDENTDYATMIYNEIISLPENKKHKIYNIICEIINF